MLSADDAKRLLTSGLVSVNSQELSTRLERLTESVSKVSSVNRRLEKDFEKHGRVGKGKKMEWRVGEY